MGEFLQNMYVWLWAALAVLMVVIGIKYRHEHQGLLAVLMALFFIFMTVWYGLRTFAGYPMFEGTLNIVFRCILGGFLIVLGFDILVHKKKKISKHYTQKNRTAEIKILPPDSFK